MDDFQEEEWTEICTQADALGMESLTEDQQALVLGMITWEKYEELRAM